MVISSLRAAGFEPGAGSHEIIGLGGASCGSDVSGLSGLDGGGSAFASAVLSVAGFLSSVEEVLEPPDVVSDEDESDESDA
jgi:hypothetical protein